MFTLFKIAVVFAGVLLLLRRRVQMGLAMLAGAVGLGLLFGLAPVPFARLAFDSATSRATIELASSILLIMLLEGVLRESGLMRLLVDSLLGLARDSRLALATLPALIGFLPSPAWSRFLAPIVGEITAGTGASSVRKAFISYWFQHVTAYISPLFPALVLGSHLLAVPLSTLIVAMLPVAVAATAIGAPFAFAGLPASAVGSGLPKERLRALLGLSRGAAPAAAVVALVLLDVNVTLALAGVVGASALVFRFGPRRLYAIGKRAVSLAQVLTMVAIMLFKDVLVGSGAMSDLHATLAALQAPPLAVILAFSFFAALLTGSVQSSIGMAVPMLAGLAFGEPPALFALVFVWGFAGLMLAPAHPCLVLTVQHFRASFAPVQRQVLLPEIALVAVVTVLYLLSPVGGG